MFSMLSRRILLIYFFSITFTFLFTGCSIKSIALNSVGDALSSGGAVFTSDNDPDLIKDALPFTLKLHESILEDIPEHKPLVLATSKAFCMYAYAFLQLEADNIDKQDFEKAGYLRQRAKLMFLRARDYALKGLELNHNGFKELLKKDYKEAINKTDKEDIPLLYWCGASWVAALTADKRSVELMVEMPIGAAMVSKVLELDETFDDGAAHEFFISYDGGRSEAMGGSEKRAREHFAKAIEISKGKKAGPYISLATSVSISKQDIAEFKSLLNKALEINPDEYPKNRLANIIMQKRARWLLNNISDFFLELEGDKDK